MKRSLSVLQSKAQPFLFLRSYLILAPIIFFIYFALNADLSGESLTEYLTSQPMNPVMLLIALLSVFWLAVLSISQNQTSEKIWNWTLIVFIASNVLTGNVVAIILGVMTMKQNVVLKDNKEGTVSNLPVILTIMMGFLVLLSLFVCFAFVRLTLA